MQISPTKSLISNTHILIFMGVILALFYTWFVFTPISYMYNHDIFLSSLGAEKLQNGYIPSVDFFSPIGILLYAMYGVFESINIAGAQKLVSFPLSIIFMGLLYTLRTKMSVSLMALLCTLYSICVLYSITSILVEFPLPASNYYNDIVVGLCIICTTIMLYSIYNDYTVKLWQYGILSTLLVFLLFYKASTALIPLMTIGFIALYDTKRLYHIAISLGIIAILIASLHGIYPDYIKAYLGDLAIVKANLSTSNKYTFYLKVMVSANVINMIALFAIHKKIYPSWKIFITFNVMLVTYLMVLGSSIYLWHWTRGISAGILSCVAMCMAISADTTPKTVWRHTHKIVWGFTAVLILYTSLDVVRDYMSLRTGKIRPSKYHVNDLPNLEYYDKVLNAKWGTPYDSYKYLSDGFRDVLQKNTISPDATISIVSQINWGDIWFNKKVSTWPTFVDSGGFSHHSHPDPYRVFKGIDYVLLINTDTCNPRYCIKYHVQMFNAIYNAYINKNYTPIYKNEVYIVYKKF